MLEKPRYLKSQIFVDMPQSTEIQEFVENFMAFWKQDDKICSELRGYFL